jgi:hypothetical protein
MASLNSKKIFSAPDWAQKELDEVEKTVQGWSRSDKLEAFARGGGDVVRALKKFPQSMWGFTAKKGNWCIGEVLWHLADQEANVYVRLRKAVSEDGSSVTAWDHTAWQSGTRCLQADPVQARDLLVLLRKANADLLRRLPAKAWKNHIQHPEFGEPTVEEMVGFNIWHLENHIGQMGRRFQEWKDGRQGR